MNFTPAQVEALEKNVAAASAGTAFARLADHFRSQGRLDQAIALCEKGIQGNPRYPTGHLLLGRCLHEKNRTEEAKAAFESVLKLDRKNIFALKIMGDILSLSGKMEEAAAFYKRASDIDPLNPELTELLRRHRQYLPSVIALSTPETRTLPALPPMQTLEPGSGTTMIDLSLSDEMSLAAFPDEAPPKIDLPEIPREPAVPEKSAIEMVDLPPAMTGYSEARVGDFGVRKSLYDRLKAEESDLVESAYGEFDRRTAYAEKILDEVPVPPQSVATPPLEVPESGPVGEVKEVKEVEEVEESAFSSAAPGMEGFYSVTGDSAESADGGSGAQLEGIDQVDLGETLSESAETPPTVAVEPPLTKVVPVQLAEGLDAEAGLQSLVEEIVDGGFLETSNPAPAPSPAPAPAPAQEPAAVESPALSDFSGAAAGADGFYNVTGDTAQESSSDPLLDDIDQVDLEQEIAEAPAAPAAPGVEVELGNEVDFQMPVLAEVPAFVGGATPASGPGSLRAQSAAAPAPVAPPAPAPVPAPAATRLAPPTPAGETAAIKVVGHVATVSLADLYLKQGHHREALAVYKKLLVLHPGDAKITQKILAIEKELKNG